VVRKGGAHGLAIVYSQHRRAELFLSLDNGKIECIDTGAGPCGVVWHPCMAMHPADAPPIGYQ
jgi:hypothetical protein